MNDSVRGTAEVQAGQSSPAVQGESGEVGLADGLPKGWAEASLFDLCRPKQWPTIATKNLSESGYPVYGANGKIGFHTEYSHEEPTILVTCRGATCGTLNVCEPKSWVNGNAMCLDDLATDAVEFEYAIYALENRGFEDVTSGSAQPQITRAGLEPVTVPVAPKAEQLRIVSAIESLQERSARAKQALWEARPLLSQLRQSVLRGAFSGRLTERWRTENLDAVPAKELLARIRTERRERWEAAELAKYQAKDKKPPKNWQDKYKEPEPVQPDEIENLPELPDSWCWGPSELIVDPGADIVYGIVQPGKKLDEGVPYVRGKDIVDGVIQVDQLLKTSEKIAAKYERASLQGGDILLGIIRATKVAIVPDVLNGANITQGTARFRPSNILRTVFLAGWLESPLAQNWLHAHYRGIDMPGLNLRDVRRLPVPIAPLAEQEALEPELRKALDSVEAATQRVASSEAELTQLDQSILAKAFRGELVPQDSGDEPASQLLHRIRTTREKLEAAAKEKKKSAKGKKNKTASKPLTKGT